jgi:Predicted permeases
MASSAVLGVLVGIEIQHKIYITFGNLGSDLYVSLAYVIVLTTIGSYVFYDAFRTQKSGGIEKKSKLSIFLQNIKLPPLVKLSIAESKISVWFIIPIGFLTGMLAATIAVGGFIGVPGMIFVVGASSLVASATELVVAFSMGLIGSIKWGMMGLIDIRLTVIILAGSLFGVQIGAYGTTFVNQNYIKKVMGTIMLLVALSRGIIIPSYLSELELITINDSINIFLKDLSFIMMCVALGAGAFMITKSMWTAKKNKTETVLAE